MPSSTASRFSSTCTDAVRVGGGGGGARLQPPASASKRQPPASAAKSPDARTARAQSQEQQVADTKACMRPLRTRKDYGGAGVLGPLQRPAPQRAARRGYYP